MTSNPFLLMKQAILFAVLLSAAGSGFAQSGRYSFPDVPSVLNAKRDFGAKGDGKADDTAALQQAIEASCGGDEKHRGKSNALFLPNGTYRVTKSLVVKTALGPWLYGESRDGVIIKLDDGVKDVTAVLRTHPKEEGPTSADWFMRNLRHFTIDVGNNPGTDGIRWYATNSGALKDVRVIGNGKVGVNSGFLDQTGPNLIQDVVIDGFETGILTQWNWSETLSRVTIRNCRKQGLFVSATVIAAEDLVVESTPLGVMVDEPNGWDHWCGVLALTGGTFSGGDGKSAAILNKGKLYARKVKSEGFSQAIDSNGSNGKSEGREVGEFLSSKARKLWDDAPDTSLGLPIKREPDVVWENDPAKWLCADDFGAVAGDGKDDTEAVQKAMDAAKARGASVVCFRGCGGADPNWYTLSSPVRVPAPVRMVMGLGWARLLGEKSGGFVVDDASAPMVKFQNIDSFGGGPIQLTNAATKNVLLVESCGVRVIGAGGGDIFLTDVPGLLDLQKPGQSCWARQFNPEGASDDGLVRNNGGNLWCLGVKHEGQGVRFSTRNGGRTEVLGLFNYGGTKDEMDARPSFIVSDASFSVAAVREIAFDQHTALNKVRETRGTETKIYDKHQPGCGGWFGWSLFSARKP
jgi:Pectate lyase superfamily protein